MISTLIYVWIGPVMVTLIFLWKPISRRRMKRWESGQNKVSTDLAPYEPAPVYETYGHPWMPIPELKSKLPKPPTGYAWEITAVLNERANPALRLGLLDLGQGIVSAFAERDMVVIRRWQYADDDTFAAFYRRALHMYPAEGMDKAERLGRQIFDAHLLSPLADWATAEVARKAVIDPPALCANYALVESA